MAKLFGTDGIRGKFGHYPITAGFAEKLGKALATFLDSRNPKIVVGRDTRKSGDELQKALVKGITAVGGEALLLGILPSNAVSFAVQREDAAAGVIISASHNPADENGFKVLGSNGFKLSETEEEQVEKLLEAGKFQENGNGREQNLEGYPAYKESIIRNSNRLAGIKIVVDAGNGATSFIAKEAFEKLGAEAHVINNKPDGSNINRNCGALYPQQLQKEVVDNHAGCGAAFDGDADRVIMADEKGSIVDGDGLILALAKHLHKKGKLSKKAVVVTEYSNTALDDELAAIGVKTVRVQNGDKYVSEEIRKNGYSLGGEQSGHIILEGNTMGDGLLVALTVAGFLKESGKPLSELARLDKKPQVLINLEVKEKKDLGKLPLTSAAIAAAEKKLPQLKGRSLIRYSGTQNMLRIMLEGTRKEEIQTLAEAIATAAKKEIGK